MAFYVKISGGEGAEESRSHFLHGCLALTLATVVKQNPDNDHFRIILLMQVMR